MHPLLTLPIAASRGGDYIFDNASLLVHGARRGFALRAASPTVPVRCWFDIGHGLVVSDSADVRIDGPFEIDYTTGAHYQGTIVALGGSAPGAAAAGGRCYRRAGIRLAGCERSATYDLWLRQGKQWVRHPHTNCFNGTGATTIAPEPYSLRSTLPGCQAACEADAACSGIIFSAPSAAPAASALQATVLTDHGFLDPDAYCARYCKASWSEHQIGPSLWRKDGGFLAARKEGLTLKGSSGYKAVGS